MGLQSWLKDRTPNQKVLLVVALLGGAFVLSAAAVPLLWKSFYEDRGVVLVNTSVIEDAGFPEIDIKVTNLTPRTCVIIAGIFRVNKIIQLDLPPFKPSRQEVSWNYNVKLPIQAVPYMSIVETSQVIEPNKADRFTFSLGYDSQTAKPHIYDFLLLLQYNDGKTRNLEVGEFAIYMPPNEITLGYYDPSTSKINVGGFTFRQVAEVNASKLEAVSRLQRTLSPSMRDLLGRSEKVINLLGDVGTRYSNCKRNLETGVRAYRLPLPFSHGSVKIAARSLKDVVDNCSDFAELQAEALYFLAQANTLLSKYKNAAEQYRMLATRFPAHKYNVDQSPLKLADLLDECSDESPEMEAFRLALLELKELPYTSGDRAPKVRRIRSLLGKSVRSICKPLKDFNEEKLLELERDYSHIK